MISYMWNLKYNINQPVYKDRNRLTKDRLVICGGGACREKGAQGRKNWEFGLSKCQQLYVEWINSKILLFNTGSCIQYSEIKP